ncbi:MAG TPA: hypothetical protein VER58_19635 [Thermoanaerobaculia bacterium]|nr:hypothetical protein [Thermoanaerobaculia bacterium]
MSRRNGDKARTSRQRKQRIVQRAKARALRAAATKQQPAKTTPR